MASISPNCKKCKNFISALKSPTYIDFMIKKSLKSKTSKSHTWAPLSSTYGILTLQACRHAGRACKVHTVKSMHAEKTMNGPGSMQTRKWMDVWQVSEQTWKLADKKRNRHESMQTKKNGHGSMQTRRRIVRETDMPALKGHGNEADFLGFLHKSVRHRSLTLHFEPFWFWLRLFVIEKRLPDLPSKSTRMPIDTSVFKPLNQSMVLVHHIPGLFLAKLALLSAGLAV